MNRFTFFVPLLFVSIFSTSCSSDAIETRSIKRVYYQDQVIVLMYHHIDPEQRGSSITLENLTRHLDTMREQGFHFIRMSDYLSFVKGEQSIPENAVVLTFDDGYESFYTYVYPELKKRGLSASNYVIVGSTDHFDPKKIPHLTWDQMREMKKNGIEFYNHTYDSHEFINHSTTFASPIFLPEKNRLETQEEYRQRIYDDLALAEKRLEEELGHQPHRVLCFPGGVYNDTILEVCNQLGMKVFLTTNEGINDRNQKLVYRISADGLTVEQLLEKIQKYTTAKSTNTR
ncbi:polysaccharide deacetylase family protein [Effusibacillus pohliae]|uniref:polysaccharide deacetylase family protein n=1 Tax=Effusibacillus pohliae TaxID=232270 RepID=UPI0003716B46|nr:polysaccharide deacetylase family protein [Effusibacillus pohliae]